MSFDILVTLKVSGFNNSDFTALNWFEFIKLRPLTLRNAIRKKPETVRKRLSGFIN